MRPRFQILSLSLLAQILDEAFQLLVDPGVRVHNEAAQVLLAEAGADLDRETQVVRIPERVARQALDSAPRAFELYDLDGNRAVHYGGDAVQFDPGSAAISILDSQTQRQRPPVTADFIRFVQLVETLPQIDAQSTAMVCADVVEEIGDLYRLYLALHFMRKPIITGAFRKDTWWPMKAMLSVVAGGDDALAARPMAVFDVCPSPPLFWFDLPCPNLIDFA